MLEGFSIKAVLAHRSGFSRRSTDNVNKVDLYYLH